MLWIYTHSEILQNNNNNNTRGFDTVKISKVKGHADEGMVLEGRVRDLDRMGNKAADEAADFGGEGGFPFM